ncbi:phage minor head protein [Acidovorax sp. GBBC 3332]|nr:MULTISPECIES: phage minor head protein [unclassified Acidovorax]MDA8449829.1 phage minor head protein [Acidovorax sp. GBBC 3297]MDA8459274.1 phage minor head protein [Acidovorax sp. GBBC 3333]MDA8464311.1 phage minor head protein [Acidovorax sp. GBBC 3332]MDA8469479.1 phage minor head protein [Acidovorax sp. GBBC 3299]
MASDLQAAFRLPFAKQASFLRAKLAMPTEDWDDIQGAAHDRAFVVAGAMRADLLADLHAAVQQAIDDGKTLAWFRGQFNSIVARHGWTGWTGEDSKAGVAWRTRTIYETNLRVSHAAGRWAQMTSPEVMQSRPYWRYVHRSTEHPRLEHKAWHGTVLPADHAWWRTHYAPNGWGCKCIVEAIGERELQRLGKTGPDTAPDDGTYDHTVASTGEIVTLPKGIQYGWDYAPGAAAAGGATLQDMVDAKLVRYPARLADALRNHLEGGAS